MQLLTFSNSVDDIVVFQANLISPFETFVGFLLLELLQCPRKELPICTISTQIQVCATLLVAYLETLIRNWSSSSK
jgi:hypothetical protein